MILAPPYESFEEDVGGLSGPSRLLEASLQALQIRARCRPSLVPEEHRKRDFLLLLSYLSGISREQVETGSVGYLDGMIGTLRLHLL